MEGREDVGGFSIRQPGRGGGWRKCFWPFSGPETLPIVFLGSENLFPTLGKGLGTSWKQVFDSFLIFEKVVFSMFLHIPDL